MTEFPTPTIDFWMQMLLPYTQNSYSNTNPSGWLYKIDTPDHRLYEGENITDYTSAVVPVYSTGTTYSIGDYVRTSLDVYESLEDDNLNYPLTNIDYWKFVTTLTLTTDLIWQPIYGDPLEKARIITINKMNLFDMLQLIAEKFEVQISFEYEYDAFYNITKRIVVIQQDVELDPSYGIAYGVNIQNISRTVNNNDFITKMYVEPIDSKYDDNGIMVIANAPQNVAMENFIYNFDYLKEIGIITKEQYATLNPLQKYLREKNLDYNIKAYDFVEKSSKYDQLTSDVTFLTYQITAINESMVQLVKDSQYYETGELHIIKLNHTFTDEYYLSLAGRKGVLAGSFIFYRFDNNDTELTLVETTNYTYVYDTEDPNSVTGIQFTAYPYPDGTFRSIVLTYNYNPVKYIHKLYLKELSTLDSLNAQNTLKTAEYEALEVVLTGLTTDIGTLLLEKETAIHNFESNIFYGIKEGVWADSDYILKKIPKVLYASANETTVVNEETVYTNSIYGISNSTFTIVNIDLDSLELWLVSNGECVYKYNRYSDYTLEYGVIGASKAILFVPIVGSGAFHTNKLAADEYFNGDTSAPTNVKLRYKSYGVFYEYNFTGKITGTVYERTFTINEVNIFPASLLIVPLVNYDPLVVNLDYTYTVGLSSSTITFLPSQKAFHINDYYSISFETNNTLKGFYADAQEVLARTSKPNVEYSISIVELSALEGYESFVPTVGKKVLINDLELKLVNAIGYVSEITYDLDNPENSSVTVSNFENIGEAQSS